MHPKAEVTVNGTPVAGAFYSRLISLRITDRVGLRSDAIEIEVEDGNPFLELPERGDAISVSLGYEEGGVVDMGRYTVDEVEAQCLPYGIRISGKSADVRADMRDAKERHWDNTTLKDIVEEIAQEHGLAPVIGDSIGQFKYDWIGQQDESDLHFLTRLSKRHGAIFAPKNGKLIFAPRGEATSAAGEALTPLVVTRDMILPNTCRVRFSDRDRYENVTALVQDRGKQKRVEAQVKTSDTGKGTLKIRDPFGSESEAKAAARSVMRETQAAADTLSVTVLGAPYASAGAPLALQGVRPGVDDIAWIIDSVTHDFSKSGYTTGIEAKRKPGAVEDVG